MKTKTCALIWSHSCIWWRPWRSCWRWRWYNWSTSYSNAWEHYDTSHHLYWYSEASSTCTARCI